MPSAEHETPIALAKLDPDVVAWLLTHVFDFKVPAYHHARSQPADVRVLVPRTYHADGMLLFCDSDDQPVLAVVLEVQRKKDPGKRRTWKLYVAQLEVELDVTAALVVFCPDPRVAECCHSLLESDRSSLLLRPLIFTPDDVPLVIDPEAARDNPALAVLSAICHGAQAEVDAMFPALAEALRSLDPRKALLYYDVVLAGLPEPARVRWEAFMTTVEDYHSELLRGLAAQHEQLGKAEGVAQGKAQGEGRAVLRVLDRRGIAVPAAVREQISACTDLAQLDTALIATTADDVIRE